MVPIFMFVIMFASQAFAFQSTWITRKQCSSLPRSSDLCMAERERSRNSDEPSGRGSDRAKRGSIQSKIKGDVDEVKSATRRGWSGSENSEKGDSIRQARFSRALRDELTDIISEIDIKASVYPDEFLLKGTSVVDVEISADLSFAKVFISVLGNSVERRQIFVWLCENVGQIKYALSRRLRHMRRVPEIFFKLADTQAGSDLVSLIEEIAPKPVSPANDVDFEEEEGYEDIPFSEYYRNSFRKGLRHCPHLFSEALS
eukprot:gene1079-2109_t